MNFQNFLSRSGLESKPFQAECFDWCLAHEQATPVPPATKKGGILALEMGLGKTIIMLALMSCNLKHHTLIVLPRSLLDQWEKVILKNLGHQPLVYHGSRPKSLQLTLAEIHARPIVLTTYGQMSMPSLKQIMKGRKKSLLHEINWNRVIYDEGHHVSHQNTNEYKGAYALKAGICWIVTGTPIQNTEKELYNLYSLFGLPNQVSYYNTAEVYADAAKQLIFHMTKTAAAIRIPELHEHTQKIEWANEAERQFAAHVHSLTTFCHVPKAAPAFYIQSTEAPHILQLKYMNRARQTCIYPALLRSTISEYEKLAEHSAVDKEQLYLAESKITAVVKTLLERKSNGCGKIVFCHYYGEIDVLAKRIQQQDPSIRIAKFDGRVSNGKREAILSQPVDILLAQIKMCREGLNLQAHYSEVYFPSPHFNPATEQQAIARCWRIGQEKPVHVFRYEMDEPTMKAADEVASAASSAADAYEVAAYEVAAYEVASAAADSEEDEEDADSTAIYSLDSYTSYLHTKKRLNVVRMEEASK